MEIPRSFLNSPKSFISYLEMIKFEHTIFALPFAYMGMFLAARGMPDLETFFFITLAFTSARTYAMTLNRLIDLPYDKKNPRTENRHLVRGKIGRRTALFGLFLSLFFFIFSAYKLSFLAFKLVPVAIFFLSFYHLTKRFTYLSHFFLGFTDGLAPAGAWVAIRNSFFSLSDLPAWLLIVIVTFWIAGFDIIYQCQDVEFDRHEGLYSIPARFGLKTALMLAKICHLIMILGLFFLIPFLSFSLPFLISCLLATLLLYREHRLISPCDLSKLDIAFFNMNGYISIIVFLGIMISIFLGGNG